MRVERDHLKKKVPEFSVGDTVRVHVKVVEGEKVRTQIFQGTVIGRRGGGIRETFIVRKISSNIAVERIFPLHSPNVLKIELIRKGRVRRAQITYMKTRKGKQARITGARVAPGSSKGKKGSPAAEDEAPVESEAPSSEPQTEDKAPAETAAE
jgi:large subunit ribosomal protein L19